MDGTINAVNTGGCACPIGIFGFQNHQPGCSLYVYPTVYPTAGGYPQYPLPYPQPFQPTLTFGTFGGPLKLSDEDVARVVEGVAKRIIELLGLKLPEAAPEAPTEAKGPSDV